jgi:methanogenic corrinoid protein MtbC1
MARCHEDIGHHLRFLQAALTSGSSGLFADYVQWLAAVLKNRGVATEPLGESLWLLDRLIAARLRGDQAWAARAVVQAGIAALDAAQPLLPAFYRKLPPSDPESPVFTEALLAGDKRAALGVVNAKLADGMDLIEVDVAVIQPALYEVGQLWQHNRISVAQEHLATAICQTVQAGALLRAEPAALGERRALFACVAGNFHSFGLRIVADAFELAGWSSAYLGADVPTVALIGQIIADRPEVVGLSAALPHHIDTIRDVIDRCRIELGMQCPSIMVGGLVMNSIDDLWQRVGADLWHPDALTARREAL